MKRTIVFTLAAITLFALVGSALAQNPSDLLFGQNHYYTVLFRGNGEAVVFAKLVFTNTGKEPLTEFAFEMPKVKPGEMVMFQQKLPRTCTRYEYSPTGGQTCAQYTEPDYGNGYYGYREGKAEYQKITYRQIGDAYDLTLPFAVDPDKSTAVIISYSAFGYVTESLGSFSFNFETLKVSSRVSQSKVTINVDTDFILKNPETTVNYQSGFGAVPTSELAAPTAISNPMLDNIARNIGNYGQITKTAQQLGPNESFTVSGEYGKNWFWLYLGSIIWALVIFVLIIVAVHLFFRWRSRRREMTSFGGNVESGNREPRRIGSPAFYVVLTGLASAIGIIGLTLLIGFISRLAAWNRLSYSSGGLFVLLIGMTLLILYALVLFGPAVLLGAKYGVRYGVCVVIAEFLWFVVFLVVYLVLFSGIVTNSGYQGGVVPL